MATRSQKQKAIKDLGMFFASLGRVPSEKEYGELKNTPPFLSSKWIRQNLGGWSIAIKTLRKEYPDLWELIHKPAEPKAKAKPVLKPKAKPAVKRVKNDE
jgi:hypothetical protein